jgi:hypothetical protein
MSRFESEWNISTRSLGINATARKVEVSSMIKSIATVQETINEKI